MEFHRRTGAEPGLQPPSIWEFGQIWARFNIFCTYVVNVYLKLAFFQIFNNVIYWILYVIFWAMIKFFGQERSAPYLASCLCKKLTQQPVPLPSKICGFDLGMYEYVCCVSISAVSRPRKSYICVSGWD